MLLEMDMLKNMMILLLIPSMTFSMDTDVVISDAVQAPCFFTLLSADVCNKIAYYLDFCETDQEFFERVRDQKEVPDEHIAQLSTHRPRIENSHGTAPPPTEGEAEFVSFAPELLKPIAAYSMDQSQIIFIEKRNYIFNIPARFAIVDIKTNTLVKNRFADSAAYQKELQEASRHIGGIALSYDGTRLAALRTIPPNHGLIAHMRNGGMLYENGLLVGTDSTIKSTRKWFTIAEDAGGNSYKIGFNKQGTKVMTIRTVDNFEKHEICKTFLLVTRGEHEARSINTLDAYFQTHWICKSIEYKKAS